MSNPTTTVPPTPNAPLTDERTWRDYFRSLVSGLVSSYASTPNGSKITTVGAAGGASALPATPVGYILITIQNTNYKVPYYNV